MMNKTESRPDEKKDKKKMIAVILLICVGLLVIGIVAAYYSDFFRQTGDLSSSTLKINGAYTYTLNGTAAQLTDLTNLNPGDVIAVRGTITNTGNQSAWVREKITFGADEILLPYLKVYRGEFTQADFVAGTDLTAYLLPVSAGTSAVSGNQVINGTGPNAQTESGGGFDYLNANTYDFTLTIYFAHTAPNATQGKTFGFTIETQALQFRNNNTAEPDETAWSAVVAAL